MEQSEVKRIAQLLSDKCYLTSDAATYNGKFLKVILSGEEAKELQDLGLPYDSLDNQLDITSIFTGDLYLYFDWKDFLNRYIPNLDLNEFSAVILMDKGSYFIKEKTDVGDSPVVNYHAYKRVLHFFLSSTDFISYSNAATREFVLISEKGPVQIGYNPLDERALVMNGLIAVYKRLILSFGNLEFLGFFRDAVIETVSRLQKQERFYGIVTALPVFLDISERDYQLYIRKFAFDKIKSKFKEERLKYFESIDKNIDTINKQVTAFPLTFSASAFASYQVKDKPYILFLILLAYMFYTFIAWRVINLSQSSITSVKKDVFVEAKSIFRVYDVIFRDFKGDFKKILGRIRQVNSLICILKVSLLFMLILFIIFVAIQILWGQPSPETMKIKYI